MEGGQICLTLMSIKDAILLRNMFYLWGYKESCLLKGCIPDKGTRTCLVSIFTHMEQYGKIKT